MRLQSALYSVSLAACFAHVASADLDVTNLSPAWVQVDKSATWVLPLSSIVSQPGCGDTCEPVGLFQFNQTFTNAPGSYTIDASDVDTGLAFADDKIYFYNSGGQGFVQFVSNQSPDFPPSGTLTNDGVLCAGLFSTGQDACSGSAVLTTTGGVQVTFTAESGIDVFGDGIPGVDDGIRFQGATATPEPSFAAVFAFALVILCVARAWKQRRAALDRTD